MQLPTENEKTYPTISLAVICKNEEKNLPRLFESVKNCFDEIVFVDTGSTDKSKEIAKEFGCNVYDFTWINDFAAARNFAFSKATKDYIMWMDCDDVLSNREGFNTWKKNAMGYADMWFATYNYAMDPNDKTKSLISFTRERVLNRAIKPEWKYRLHEGIVFNPNWTPDYAHPSLWTVNHLRDLEDMKQDQSRNIKILEEIKVKDGLDPRLQFYYGKELYEAHRPQEAIAAFEAALPLNLEQHDRILSLQYAAYSCVTCSNQLKDEFKDQKQLFLLKAIDFGLKGLGVDPNRAEFHVLIGDCFLQLGRMREAVPFYSAAKRCFDPKSSGSPYEGAIYSFVDCYGIQPILQLAKIYFHLGQLDKCKKEALEALELKPDNQDAKNIMSEIERVTKLTTIDQNQEEVEDIVFTCPPQTAYPFDEELYKTKAMGGSETALIEVAAWLKKLTGRRVLVFNMRDEDLTAESGVEYIPSSKLNEYFATFKPKVHIAWRHNVKVTNAPTYLWCHDLFTQSVESAHNFDKILCLTQFHKNYVMAKQAVPEDKIIVTRNGIVPERFEFEKPEKNENKLVWMSSPDRGLDSAMLVCDEVRKDFPDIELHVYNSIENLYKYGPKMSALADHLRQMIKDRPYVKYHGFTEQSKMYKDVADAVVWVHPCNFIETFCITALEMLALKIFPVTRSLGGLKDTLREATMRGDAITLNHDCFTEERKQKYVDSIKLVLMSKAWEKITFNPEKHSWKSVCEDWMKFMGITKLAKDKVS